jgi:hypothetical protein
VCTNGEMEFRILGFDQQGEINYGDATKSLRKDGMKTNVTVMSVLCEKLGYNISNMKLDEIAVIELRAYNFEAKVSESLGLKSHTAKQYFFVKINSIKHDAPPITAAAKKPQAFQKPL